MGGCKHNIQKFPRMRGAESKKMRTLGNLKIPEARMNSNCSVAEVVQISLAAAEDVVTSYTGEINKLVIQQTLFLEGLKKVLFKKEIVTEEEFGEILKEVADEYKKQRDDYLESVLNKEPEVKVEEEDVNETEGH